VWQKKWNGGGKNIQIRPGGQQDFNETEECNSQVPPWSIQ